jgi:tetratricopeptide (TPR) repeat protein
MLRRSPSARRTALRGFGSAVTVAIALAGGAAVVTAATAAPAAAQRSGRNNAAPQPQNSEAFVKAYEPVAAIVSAEGGDYAAAKAQLPGVIAAIETPDDRNAAGNMILTLGNKLKDVQLQRQGLELMVASGKTDPAQLGQFQFFIGSLAYDAKDWAAARTALQAALAAGYTEGNPEAMIAETYFGDNQAAQGLDYLKSLVEKKVAAGQTVPEAWYLRGLKVSYDARLADKTTEWSQLLVASAPNQTNWQRALQVVGAVNDLDAQAQLDLLRLMLATNSLTERSQFVTYIETADARIMANEVSRVLAAGLQAGIFSSTDDYYTEVKRVVDQRAPEDRRDAPGLATEARRAANGTAAQNAGDVYLSLGSWAEAESMYALALEKGGVDRDRTLTRLGIAQAQQGKKAEASATFGQVTGARVPVAKMWTAYVESRA